jgi:hypothetical protein
MCPGFHFSFIISIFAHTCQEKNVGVSPLVTLPVHYLPGPDLTRSTGPAREIADIHQPGADVVDVEFELGFGKTCKAMM